MEFTRDLNNMNTSSYIGSPAWERGQKVEREFEALLKLRDPNFRRATLQEQYRHIDFVTYFGTVDVKAKKRMHRGASSTQDDNLWVEHTAVNGGAGWLRAEHLDILAFEREECFTLVKREDLLELVDNLCDLRIMDNDGTTNRPLYRGYTRRGRKDVLSIISYSDLDLIKTRTWMK